MSNEKKEVKNEATLGLELVKNVREVYKIPDQIKELETCINSITQLCEKLGVKMDDYIDDHIQAEVKQYPIKGVNGMLKRIMILNNKALLIEDFLNTILNKATL